MEEHEDQEEEQWWRGPLKWIGAVFLILVLVGWYFPYYNVKYNPQPQDIPTRAELMSIFAAAEVDLYNRTNKISDATSFIDPHDTNQNINHSSAKQHCL